MTLVEWADLVRAELELNEDERLTGPTSTASST